jgi:hypothetical protein
VILDPWTKPQIKRPEKLNVAAAVPSHPTDSLGVTGCYGSPQVAAFVRQLVANTEDGSGVSELARSKSEAAHNGVKVYARRRARLRYAMRLEFSSEARQIKPRPVVRHDGVRRVHIAANGAEHGNVAALLRIDPSAALSEPLRSYHQNTGRLYDAGRSDPARVVKVERLYDVERGLDVESEDTWFAHRGAHPLS